MMIKDSVFDLSYEDQGRLVEELISLILPDLETLPNRIVSFMGTSSTFVRVRAARRLLAIAVKLLEL